MAFFFPQVHVLINWKLPHEFLDKELQKLMREARMGRRYADQLVKVRLKSGKPILLLCHIEVQAGREAGFAERMYRYHYRIQERYKESVSSFAILCDGNPNWRPDRYEQFLPGTTLQFQYSLIKLLDYETRSTELDTSQNPFSIVVKAHLKAQATKRRNTERRQWKFALVRELYDRGYSAQDVINLFQFIDWIMRLPDNLEALFWEEVETYEGTQTMPYITSVERIGMRRGEQQGKAALALKLVDAKFGEVAPEVVIQIQRLPSSKLDELAIALLNFQTINDLSEWLNQSET